MHSVVPLRHNGKLVFAIVMHEDTFERVKGHDPAVILGSVLQESFTRNEEISLAIPLLLCDFMICYEPDKEAFLAKVGELKTGTAVLKYLTRNWKEAGEEPLKQGHYEFSDVSVES